MIDYWLSNFVPFVMFLPPIAPLLFCPLAHQNRPQGGDSAHFEKHWLRRIAENF